MWRIHYFNKLSAKLGKKHVIHKFLCQKVKESMEKKRTFARAL